MSPVVRTAVYLVGASSGRVMVVSSRSWNVILGIRAPCYSISPIVAPCLAYIRHRDLRHLYDARRRKGLQPARRNGRRQKSSCQHSHGLVRSQQRDPLLNDALERHATNPKYPTLFSPQLFSHRPFSDISIVIREHWGLEKLCQLRQFTPDCSSL
jgi:hypothetical protein